jgi:catechol 2,3-dioxygenase-like lactoylglutathione lyase family enzyme
LARFYGEQLELREVARHHGTDGALRSVWFDLGGAILMIEHGVDEPRHVNGVGAGLFLIAIAVEATQRELFERRLERAGALIESRTEWTSYMRDPDGNRIAISAYPLNLVGPR